ncbi:MAG TPA: class I SAM-dependent methyltransferase [Pyrinomonadaceae bacterium]|jgi:ubiquinone/menaquinone biosynthesis C-methylase UbiE
MDSEKTQSEQLALGHLAIHETVESILEKQPRGKVLDIPAGKGALTLRLKKLGHEVFCSDLYPQIFKLADTEIKFGDLDARLPFEDETFDYIACVEGLEHIENPANAIREFARLLKRGGLLVVSVPNIMNIEERLKWLFSGYTSHFKPLSREAISDIKHEIGDEYSGMEEVALHVNPIGYSEVRFLLEKSNFTLEKTFLDKRKKNTWLFYPIVALIKLSARFTSEKKRRSRWTSELNSDEVLRGGNTLIFQARKN